MSTFQNVILLVTCLRTFLSVGSSLITGLDNVINQYGDCFNVVHFCDVKNTLFLGTKVPVYLMTTFLKLSDLPHTKHLSCLMKFVVFPERLECLFVELEKYGRGIKSETQTRHFFTTEADRPAKLSRRVSTSNVVIHELTSKGQTPELFQILSTFLYFIYNKYSGLTRLRGTGLSLESEIETNIRLISRSGLPNDSRYNGTEFSSVTSLIKPRFGNPFKFNNKIHGSHQSGDYTVILEFMEICAMLAMEAQNLWLPPNLASLEHIWRQSQIYVSKFRNEAVGGSNGFTLLVITGKTFANFATCDGVTQKVSFQFYANPYDQACWIFYLSTVVFILPLFVVLMQHTHLQKAAYVHLYTHITEFCVFSTMNICPDIPVEYTRFFRRETIIVLGLWLVATVTLGNAYKGIVSSDLTAPYFITSKWKNFSETTGFLYFASPEVGFAFLRRTFWHLELGTNQKIYLVNPIRGCVCFSEEEDFIHDLCKASFPSETMVNPWNLTHCPEIRNQFIQRDVQLPQKTEAYCNGAKDLSPFLEEYKNLSKWKSRNRVEHLRKIGSVSLSPLREFAIPFCKTFVYFDNSKEGTMIGLRHEFPFINSLMQGIPLRTENWNKEDLKIQFSRASNGTSTCTRTAYLNTDSKLDAFLAYSEMTGGINYRKGKETIIPVWDGFLFPKISWYSGMQTLMTSGIYNIWEKWYTLQYPKEEHDIIKNYTKLMAKTTRVSKLTMQTNIWSIFLVYFILLPLCFLAFIAECAIKYRRTCSNLKKIAFRIKMYLSFKNFNRWFTQRRIHLSDCFRKLTHRIHVSIH